MFRSKHFTKQGFTLIEIIMVIAVIGVLSTVAFIAYGEVRKESQYKRAQADLDSIRLAMEVLKADTGRYSNDGEVTPRTGTTPPFCTPSGVNGLEFHLDQPSVGLLATNGNFPNWSGPYINNVIDPWGTPYQIDEDYFCTGNPRGCEGIAPNTGVSALISCGPNKVLSSGGEFVGVRNANGFCTYDSDNVVLILQQC